MSDITTGVETARNLTVQSDKRIPASSSSNPYFMMGYLAASGGAIAPWWSARRDKDIRKFWKQSDHLSGAIYTMESKMASIPCRVVARNQSNKQYVKQAEQINYNLKVLSEFGKGWVAFFAKFVEDLITQDNGAFAEVLGEGPKDGPIIGQPLALVHLDASRCQRTSDPIYPVIYHDRDGKLYKLHFTRVIEMSQMTSPDETMNGVGFCAVSRCASIAQTLIDIITFKQEKLGSRPQRALMITRGGLAPDDIAYAFNMVETTGNNANMSRYSKIAVGGSMNFPEGDVKMIELSSLPDGFNEETSTTFGMAVISLALGVDARELFPAMTSGATRADALLQHLKQRGKGPGQIIEAMEQAMNAKFLPPHLRFEFDFQDDAQDRQVAEIRQIRANSRLQDMNSGTINTRTMREQMVEQGDLTREQFEYEELLDGRLPDGNNILTLFYSDDPSYTQYLDLGSDDPTDILNNDPMAMQQAIHDATVETTRVLAKTDDPAEHSYAFQSLAALAYLAEVYKNQNLFALSPLEAPNKVPPVPPAPPTGPGQGHGNGPTYVDPRVRTQDPAAAKEPKTNVSPKDSSMQPSWNDGQHAVSG